MKYRAVLFDAGNTLLGLDHERIAPAVASALGLPLTAAMLRAASPRAALAMEEGKFDPQLAWLAPADKANAFAMIEAVRSGIIVRA